MQQSFERPCHTSSDSVGRHRPESAVLADIGDRHQIAILIEHKKNYENIVQLDSSSWRNLDNKLARHNPDDAKLEIIDIQTYEPYVARCNQKS
uniref:Uncharacterized protein n=1 Tax=Romanomermis culicivorax TaxID=13658 RepID=A0A915J8L1_ROMCU